jgi:hypothetical protein
MNHPEMAACPRAALFVAVLAIVAACYVPAPASHGPNPTMVSNEEPVGYLLERADSLHLPDSTRLALSRLNVRLFGRNQPLRFALDTMLEHSHFRPQPGRPPAEQEMPPELRERIEPVAAQIRANNEAARDTAWAMLTDAQRTKAEEMRHRTPQPGQAPPEGRPHP